MKKVISQEQKDAALDALNYSFAKVEHLLQLDVFYVKDESDLLNWLPIFTNKVWEWEGVNIVYQGYSTGTYNDGKEYISNVYFRTDKVVDLDDLVEIIGDIYGSEDYHNISFIGATYKTMVCSEIEDIYLDLEYHGSVDSYQDFYGFDDNEMLDIFGEEDAKYFMSH